MLKRVSDALCTYDNVRCSFDTGFSLDRYSAVEYDKLITDCQSGPSSSIRHFGSNLVFANMVYLEASCPN